MQPAAVDEKAKRMFDELKAEIVSAGIASSRDTNIFTRLHGLDGHYPESLRKTAARYGLSAERVRKIAERVFSEVSVFFASGDKSECIRARLGSLTDAVASRMPGTDEQITRQLIDAGLFKNDGRMASSVVRISDIAARNPGIRLDKWGNKQAILSSSAPRCFQTLITLAGKVAGASGAVGANSLTAHFAESQSIHLGPNDVRAMLSSCAKSLGWHNEQEWFHFPDLNNDAVVRASNRAGSLGRFSLSHLAAIDNRVTRSGYGTSLPEVIMARLLQFNGFEIDADSVTKLNDVGERLSRTQMKMVEVLKNMGGIARQIDYIRACAGAGVNIRTARVYIRRSGLFECANGHCSIAS